MVVYNIIMQEGFATMMTMIKFGTDGWRAVMADHFTFANVEIVAQSIADYVNGEGMGSRGLIVGYDNRFLAEHFAARVGEVLAGNNIPVFLTAGACPTPVTAYAITTRQTAGAIMLTASHNPPEYNGIKFIPDYAGPAVPAITDKIEGYLHKVLETGRIRKLARDEALAQGLWNKVQPKDEYLQHIAGLVDLSAIKKAGLKLVLDPMYGAGIGYLEELLGEACEITAIHNYRDPLFGGALPEPTGNNLEDLRACVLKAGCDLGLALDGDADRFGIIDSDGSYISPNQVLALLYYHLARRKGISGPVARTVATTHLLDRMAEGFGQKIKETPVGFKYIGQMMREKGCVLGGEESGGLSIAGHIPEKDGILACALMAEIRALTGETLQDNLEKIAAEFGRLYSERLDVHTSKEKKEQVLGKLPAYFPSKIAGIPVTGRLTVDGTKLLLAEGSWVLIRPSGTEPLFRIYVETNSLDLLKKIQSEVVRELEIADVD